MRPASISTCWSANYLVDISAGLAPETVATYQAYFVNNFASRFDSLGSITSSAMQDYSRARLRQVKRGTVCKELSAMPGVREMVL